MKKEIIRTIVRKGNEMLEMCVWGGGGQIQKDCHLEERERRSLTEERQLNRIAKKESDMILLGDGSMGQ